jgi:methyltransferase (TIGR00027 family)
MQRSPGPSKSAALVAACRMLAVELPVEQRLMDDPFARLVVDDAAVTAARADGPLQNSIRLRTRYIDDAVLAFGARHASPQIVLLGAGYDSRAFRLNLSADFFEVDFPATLHHKDEVMTGIAPINHRVPVAVDLANTSFVDPLVAAGFDVARPAIVVWEGVTFYLSSRAAADVVAQIAAISATGSVLVADYAEVARVGAKGFGEETKAMSKHLGDGGEPLLSGLSDMHGTLTRAGFDVVDDEVIELLSPRYGCPVGTRHYPSRIFTAHRRALAA